MTKDIENLSTGRRPWCDQDCESLTRTKTSNGANQGALFFPYLFISVMMHGNFYFKNVYETTVVWSTYSNFMLKCDRRLLALLDCFYEI